MKSKEINKLSKDELKNKINSLKKDLFNFRYRKVNGQIDDTAKVFPINPGTDFAIVSKSGSEFPINDVVRK